MVKGKLWNASGGMIINAKVRKFENAKMSGMPPAGAN